MPRFVPPAGCAGVRMYRQGHGDCFLLAFPREGGGDPVYVLVDCGYKPGSPAYLSGRPIGDVVDHIAESTGRRLDLAVITHEHQDHVNGLWKATDPYFGGFRIDEAWMAWTEDPDDPLADALRKKHRDVLLGLAAARRKLALAVGDDDPAVRRIDGLLATELGVDGARPAALLAAAGDPTKSVNKQAMKLIKDRAREHRGVRYLRPGGRSRKVPESAGVRAYVLGPPYDAGLLGDEDPAGGEAFPKGHGFSFGAAAAAEAGRGAPAPFSNRHCIPAGEAFGPEANERSFFVRHYGRSGDGLDDRDGAEVPPNAAWRRIEGEWLYAAETLALSLNAGVNNTSLVLAFELPASRKVLLFVGDAQRGSWASWAPPGRKWKVGKRIVTPRDLLARTVLYKVGHHGSHNATLNGTAADPYANLAWMGLGERAGEFAAMIPAVNRWAVTENDPPWYHPLPSIKRALLEKARGRVFQTDEDRPRKPDDVPAAEWAAFMGRTDCQELYFDYVVRDA